VELVLTVANFIPFSVAHRNMPELRDEDIDDMNKGLHTPTFDNAAHGKLRVKSEMGEFCRCLLLWLIVSCTCHVLLNWILYFVTSML